MFMMTALPSVGMALMALGIAVDATRLGALEPIGERDAAIVPSSAALPTPLLVDTEGGTPLDLIAGYTQKKKLGALHFSLWLVGGASIAPLVRDQPLKGEETTDAGGSVRLHFKLPAFSARPGATLRLVIDEEQSHQVVIDAWLLVSEPYNPADLREWAEKHSLSVDPALGEVMQAFHAWEIPLKELGDAPLAVLSADTKVPPTVRTALILRSSKDGRTRIVVRPSAGRTTEIDAMLPSLVAFTSDPSARQDLLLSLREAADASWGDNDFPNP
jgi:hypothetical protein